MGTLGVVGGRVPRRLSRGAAVGAVLISAMWGLNIVGIKVALSAFPPVWNAFWRMLLGWPVLWLWARKGGVRLRLLETEVRPLAKLGVLFGIQIILLNLSVDWTSAGFAAVLLNAAPVFINALAHFYVPGDRISPRRAAGLALSFGGVAVVMLTDPDPSVAARPMLGNVLALLTAALIGARMVYTQRLVQWIHPVRAIFWQVGFSLPVFLPCALAAEPLMVGPLTLEAMLSWLYCSLAVVGFAFVMWIRLLEAHSPGLLSVFVFPTPLFGVVFSALILGEDLPAGLLAGVASVALGILLVALERRAAGTELPEGARDLARVS